MNKQELIDKTVHELKGVYPGIDIGVDLKFLCRSVSAASGYGTSSSINMPLDGYICTKDEFQQRASELGYVNGYRWGVEYATNGKKPDLTDDCFVLVKVSNKQYNNEWIEHSLKVFECGWIHSVAFKITDQRHKPADTSYLNNQRSSKDSSNHDVDMISLMEIEFANRSQAFKDLIGDAFYAAIDRLQSEQAEAERDRVVDAAWKESDKLEGHHWKDVFAHLYDAGFLRMPEGEMTHPITVQQEIVRMYSAGVSLKVIEAETGVSMRTVISMVKRKNVPMRREKGKKESAILSLWKKGLNKTQIARETGYCWLTVHNTIKAAT